MPARASQLSSRRGRVPVGVVRADGDQRDPGAAGGEEPGIGVAAAVVRHLEHVGPQVDPGREQPRLGLRAEVAGEQDPDAAHGRPDDQRQVVGLRGRRRPLRGGCQHLERDAVRPSAGPPARATARAPPPPDQPSTAATRSSAGDSVPVATTPTSRPASAPASPPDVVGVEVRQQHQRQPVDAEVVQAPVDRQDVRARRPPAPPAPGPVGSTSASPWPTSQATTTVSGGGQPRTACRTGHPTSDEADQDGQRQRPEPAEAPQRATAAQQERRPAGRRPPGPPASRCAASGSCGGALGDEHQPPGRPAGEPDEHVADGRHRGAHDGGQRCRARWPARQRARPAGWPAGRPG